jgi:hypothetical protein
MSLETKIEALTQAVIALTAKLESSNVAPAAPVAPAPTPVVEIGPVVGTPATVVVAPVAPAMPAPPAFVAPAPVAAPVATGAPFSDPKGLIDYVMASYKSLGTKGQLIQGVLTQMGYQNINDVKPEHYGALFAGVEALK